MALPTGLMQRLGLGVPVIQAPLGGGGDTPAMTAAVSEGGGLGFIGAAYMTPQAIGAAAGAVRTRTNRVFGVNIFAPQRPAPVTDATAAMTSLASLAASLEPGPAVAPLPGPDPFEGLFQAALASGAGVFSFTFGTIPAAAMAELKARGILVIGTATTVREAVALKECGVDAIVAQGAEAGGHRGSFDPDGPGALVGTVALVPQVVDATGLPVIASGGIMDGRGIAAALALGADAVQMGTGFLTTAESGIIEPYRQAIIDAADDATRVTRAFSGRPARGIVNRFMTATEAAGADAILPFPLQNALTRPMRTAAARAGQTEFLSLWAGQGSGLARRTTTAELMARLSRETEAALARLR